VDERHESDARATDGLALADGLSGTLGQVASPYGVPEPALDADDTPPVPAVLVRAP